jgi:hypothetical protein
MNPELKRVEVATTVEPKTLRAMAAFAFKDGTSSGLDSSSVCRPHPGRNGTASARRLR